MKERKILGLEGMLPSAVETLEDQVNLAYRQVSEIEKNYEKNKYLMGIYNSNRTVYYALIIGHIKELMPVIYTPTIAQSVTDFSVDYLGPNDAVYLDINHPDQIEPALKNASKNNEGIDLLIITDGEGVLGIGDWGVQGVMIVIGKLTVYTIAAGIDPRRILPIIIDNGTNREELLNSPFYLGNKQRRKTGNEYYEFIDTFVSVAKSLFSKALFHWEDFGRENASYILKKYRHEITTFNDDIQGTGVMMSAAMNAVAEITNTPVIEHKVIIFGAGSAGIGIAEQIKLEMTLNGISEEEAKKRFYLVDKYGLVIENQTELTEGQKYFARKVDEFKEPVENLLDIVRLVQPSVLIGTSGQPNAFTEEVIKEMALINDRPAIFPISNPSELQEAKAEKIIEWTDGKGLVVTGSPSEPVWYGENIYQIGQANNALLYPGLGLGIVASKSINITDGMLSAAAHSISKFQDLDKIGSSLLPPLELIRDTSKSVAIAVVEAALKDNVATAIIDSAEQSIQNYTWEPFY